MARRISATTDSFTGLRGVIITNLEADLARLQGVNGEVYDFSGECARLQGLITDLRAGRVVELHRWGSGVSGEAARMWPAGARLCTLQDNTLTPAHCN